MPRTTERSNPYTAISYDAESIIPRLDEAAQRLCEAIAAHNDAQAVLRRAKDDMDSLESRTIFEESLKPDGKLKGVATTSKLYAHALAVIIADAKEHHLLNMELDLRSAQSEADDAAAELQQAQTMFNALRHIAELKGAILTSGQTSAFGI